MVPLPTPTPSETEEFKRLYAARTGVELTDSEALDAATRLVQLVFLTKHALPHLRKAKPEMEKDASQ